MISDGHLTIWHTNNLICLYMCELFVWYWYLLLKIDICNNEMIHYLNITSWLYGRCLVISYKHIVKVERKPLTRLSFFLWGVMLHIWIYLYLSSPVDDLNLVGCIHHSLIIVNITINSHMALIACFLNINMFITPNSAQWEVNPTVWLYKRSLFY